MNKKIGLGIFMLIIMSSSTFSGMKDTLKQLKDTKDTENFLSTYIKEESIEFRDKFANELAQFSIKPFDLDALSRCRLLSLKGAAYRFINDEDITEPNKYQHLTNLISQINTCMYIYGDSGGLAVVETLGINYWCIL